jgi:hypothetical protein
LGKVERDGYSVEKVYFETWPGLFLGGNLYRPLGRGNGPFPAILNPHGHWANGRMADNKDCSIAGRCINFARQGMIAFSYDMIGYNDTHFANVSSGQSFSDIHHEVATNETDLLWNISLMGLQTWNSIRALDFLESLPDADRKRLACTGESGGGTQTFMLGAIDDRLAVQAPIVMVSHIMQGGCLCENAPGLRVQFSNMEIAAAAAPRPQILVAAAGDWTKDTLTVEGPSIGHIYELLQRPDRFNYVRYDFDHNYNQTSREAVYGWFGKWLLGSSESGPVKERPFQKERDEDLRVFQGKELPPGAVGLGEFLKSMRDLHRKSWQALLPHDPSGLKRFKTVMQPAWRHTLQINWPEQKPEVHMEAVSNKGEFSGIPITITRPGESAGVRCTYWSTPGISNNAKQTVVVLATANQAGLQESNAKTSALPFLKRGLTVLSVNRYSSSDPAPDQFKNFYSTYNRTELQERVRDLVTVCAAARSIDTTKRTAFRVALVGNGRAGLWSLLAAPAADAVIADGSDLDVSNETALLASDLFCPGILAMGGFEGAAMLAAPNPLILHHTGPNFAVASLTTAYQASEIQKKLRIEAGPLTETEIVEAAAHF